MPIHPPSWRRAHLRLFLVLHPAQLPGRPREVKLRLLRLGAGPPAPLTSAAGSPRRGTPFPAPPTPGPGAGPGDVARVASCVSTASSCPGPSCNSSARPFSQTPEGRGGVQLMQRGWKRVPVLGVCRQTPAVPLPSGFLARTSTRRGCQLPNGQELPPTALGRPPAQRRAQPLAQRERASSSISASADRCQGAAGTSPPAASRPALPSRSRATCASAA
jgi:hypothetical protein